MGKSIKPYIVGGVASVILLIVYATVVVLVSGLTLLKEQVRDYWYYLLLLTIGFGIQVGLYVYLKSLVKQASAKMIVATGTTSTAAMISCCSHYLINILPILGAMGIVTFLTQYQIQLFWVGLFFNFLGIIYIAKKVRQIKNHL